MPHITTSISTSANRLRIERAAEEIMKESPISFVWDYSIWHEIFKGGEQKIYMRYVRERRDSDPIDVRIPLAVIPNEYRIFAREYEDFMGGYALPIDGVFFASHLMGTLNDFQSSRDPITSWGIPGPVGYVTEGCNTALYLSRSDFTEILPDLPFLRKVDVPEHLFEFFYDFDRDFLTTKKGFHVTATAVGHPFGVSRYRDMIKELMVVKPSSLAW